MSAVPERRRVPAWTDISTDFDPDEETANFGTRHALESEGNIYEVVTLSTIEPSEEATAPPSLQSACKKNILLAVDSTLVIFSKDCQDAEPLLFNSIVDTLSVSSCANFALLGTRCGGMEFLHIPTRRILASIPLTHQNQQQRTFVCSAIIGEGRDSQMYLVSSDCMFTFSNLDLGSLDASVRAGDKEALMAAQAALVKKQYSLDLDVVTANVFSDSQNNISVVVAHTSGVSALGVGSEEVEGSEELDLEAFHGNTVRKMITSMDKARIYCLDSEGRIHVLCTLTYTLLKTYAAEVAVLDMVLLEEEGEKDFQFMLTVQDGNDRFLELRSARGFKLNYRLKVSEFCVPLSADVSQDTPMVVEGVNEDVLRPNLVDKLRVRGVTEGVPEVRLERILRRGKFDEAEKFAQTFNLNTDSIYKRKVSWLLERLSPWNTSLDLKAKAELFADLKLCLGRLQDLEFVIECCSVAALPSLAMTREILLFAREKIGSQEESTELNSKHLLSIGVTKHRLETYMIAGLEPSVEEWIQFSRADILVKITKALEAGSTNTALLYWVRHKSELRPRLCADVVSDLLAALPDNLDIQSQLHWLRQFIPDILQWLPSTLPLVAEWAGAAVLRLELNRKEWPENGLTFTQEVLATMQFGRTDDFNQFMTILTLNQQRTETDSALAKLINLINFLQDLLELKKKFRIKMKLAEMMDPNKLTVVSNILDWVMVGEEVPALMDGFLVAFINKFQLNQNQTLMEYIMNVLHNTNYTWHWHVGAAPWEEKVAFLLPYITSVDEKCQVILETVEQAPVPWSSTIKEICETGSKLAHPGAVKIKEQRSLVSVKAILRKYECKTYLTSGREADRQLQYILLRGDEEGYHDILEICRVMGTKSTLEVNKLYIDHLIEVKRDARSALKVVQTVMAGSERDGVELCRDAVERAGIAFKVEVGPEVEDANLAVLVSIVSTYGSQATAGMEELVSKGRVLVNAKVLKRDFGIKTAETDWMNRSGSIRDVANNRVLLTRYIAEKVGSVEAGEATGTTMSILGKNDKAVEAAGPGRDLDTDLNQILRVCDLMGLTHEEGIGRYILELNKRGWYAESLEVAKRLNNSTLNSSLANILFSVVYNTEMVAGGSGEVGALPDLLSNLTANSLVHCQDSAIMDSLELYNWQNITSRIHAESHDRRAYSAANTASVNVFDQWKFSHVFKDKGLPLEREDILPFGFQCLESILPLVEEPPLPFLPRNTACTVQVCDLDVTCPDLESVGNGVDAKAVSLGLLSSANSLVSCLQGAGHAQLAFQALERVESSLDSILLGTDAEFQTEVQTKIGQVKVNLVSQLIQRVLHEPLPDPKLCLGLLALQDSRTALNLLAKINTSFGQDYRKMMSLSLVGHQFCRLNELAKQAEQFMDLYIRSSWGKMATLLEVSFKSAFSGSVKEKLDALQKFVVHPQVGVETLLQYSAAFKIDPDQTLVLYSAALVGRMEPAVADNGDIVPQPDLSDIWERVEQAWAMFSAPQPLFQHLLDQVSAVSPYNYEGLEVLLRGIRESRFAGKLVPEYIDRASRILGFLLQYKRIEAPSPEAEVDPWLKERGTSFSRLAGRRLPLYPLVVLNNKEKCKLLEKEFSLETYRSWILVSEVLGISVDNICMFTVTNTVSSIIERNTRAGIKAEEWIISHNNRNALKQLRDCILEMKNPEKATAASSWIVNRLPRGADKVLAAHGHLAMAEAWASREPANQSSRVGLSIATKTRDQLETEQALCRFSLATTPEYLQFVEQHKPLELITKLFEDDSILERNRIAAGNYPDIASAVEEIARINRLNSSGVKYDLLDRWLPVSGCSLNNQTLSDFNLDLGGGSGGEEGGSGEDQDSVNLLRCIYILQDGSEDGIRYLLRFALTDDPLVSTVHKLRALKCLFSIAGEEELTRLTGRNVDELKETIKNLVFISRMEKLNLPFNAQSFQTCNKDSLVEGIWRTCKHSTEGIVLVRDLCAEFNIWNQSTWTALLIQINKYGMMKELENTLVLLSSQPQMWNSQQFISSWNTLLLSPFTSLLPPVSEDEERRCREVLSLVHCCPTAMDLQLGRIVEECLRIDLAHLALILVPYLSQEEGMKVKERVHNQLSQVELTARLTKLEQQGFPLAMAFSNKPETTSPAL